jgi:hypothetical protein
LGGKKEMRESKIKSLVDKAQQYAEKELRNFIKMKCIDLRYFIMKHFNNEFSNEGDIPRQWPSFKEEDIKALFVSCHLFRRTRRRSTHASLIPFGSLILTFLKMTARKKAKPK